MFHVTLMCLVCSGINLHPSVFALLSPSNPTNRETEEQKHGKVAEFVLEGRIPNRSTQAL